VNTLTIRIGSRGSNLALWQANHVAALLRSNGHTVEIEVIRTTGDRLQNAPLDGLSPNGTGIFIKEIEEALAAGRIDLAVHSLKDLPTDIDPRFTLAAIPPRADARDAFVCESSWGLHMLLVLASAGLDRLGLTEHVHQRFSVDELTPAPGQGALALQTRSPQHPLDTEDSTRDPAIHAAVRTLNCAHAEYAVTAERAVLAALGGGCQLPLGAYCHTVDEIHHLHAMVVSPDGDQVAHVVQRAPVITAATDLGQSVAEALIARGAFELLGMETVGQSTAQP